MYRNADGWAKAINYSLKNTEVFTHRSNGVPTCSQLVSDFLPASNIAPLFVIENSKGLRFTSFGKTVSGRHKRLMVTLDYRPQHLLRTRPKIIRWFRRTRIQSRKAGLIVNRRNALPKLAVRYQPLRHFSHGLPELATGNSGRTIELCCWYELQLRRTLDVGYLGIRGVVTRRKHHSR